MLEQLDDRVEGTVDVKWRAEVAQGRIGLIPKPVAQRADHSRLAYARLTREQDHLTFTFLRQFKPFHEQPDLMLTPNDWGKRCSMQGFKAAFGRTFSDDPPSSNRIVKPFDAMCP